MLFNRRQVFCRKVFLTYFAKIRTKAPKGRAASPVKSAKFVRTAILYNKYMMYAYTSN